MLPRSISYIILSTWLPLSSCSLPKNWWESSSSDADVELTRLQLASGSAAPTDSQSGHYYNHDDNHNRYRTVPLIHQIDGSSVSAAPGTGTGWQDENSHLQYGNIEIDSPSNSAGPSLHLKSFDYGKEDWPVENSGLQQVDSEISHSAGLPLQLQPNRSENWLPSELATYLGLLSQRLFPSPPSFLRLQEVEEPAEDSALRCSISIPNNARSQATNAYCAKVKKFFQQVDFPGNNGRPRNQCKEVFSNDLPLKYFHSNLNNVVQYVRISAYNDRPQYPYVPMPNDVGKYFQNLIKEIHIINSALFYAFRSTASSAKGHHEALLIWIFAAIFQPNDSYPIWGKFPQVSIATIQPTKFGLVQQLLARFLAYPNQSKSHIAISIIGIFYKNLLPQIWEILTDGDDIKFWIYAHQATETFSRLKPHERSPFEMFESSG